MYRIFNFVRSDLFLSLAGGFALGVAGLAVIQPANADIGRSGTTKSISVGAAVHEEIAPLK